MVPTMGFAGEGGLTLKKASLVEIIVQDEIWPFSNLQKNLIFIF